MTLPLNCYDSISKARDPLLGPLQTLWPMPGSPAATLSFAQFEAWRDFLLGFSLTRTVPYVVSAKFERAQKLYLLTWIDSDLLKAGELLVLTTLELAVTDRYAGKEKARRIEILVKKAEISGKPISEGQQRWIDNISFADLLNYMVERDDLTDDKVPLVKRCGAPSTIKGLLTGETRPSLADIRNDLAHGKPIEGFPKSGLFELARDLIDYAYRDFYIA